MGTRTGARANPQNAYHTGDDYPAAAGPGGEDRDLYGEDDPVPEELEASLRRVDDEDEQESTRAGPPRKLIVLSGPEKGKVKRLSGVRMVLGRATGCHLQLDDKSISRRHLELIQGERGVLLRDLVSGNGTKVNGERVEERLLKHEDVIEIGSSRLQFVDELEAVKKAREEADRKAEDARRAKEEAEKKKSDEEAAARAAADAAAAEQEKARAAEAAAFQALPPVERAWRSMSPQQRLAVGLGGLVVLLGIVTGLWLLFRDPGPPPQDAREVLANKKMEQARVALADGRYEDAANLIETAERIRPGIDEDGLGDVARKEMAADKSLQQARALIDQERFEEAKAELARTPEASAKWSQLRQQLEQEVVEKQAAVLEKQAQDALDALDPATAEPLIAMLPPERQKAMSARLEEVKELVEKQRAMDTQAAAQAQQRGRERAVAARRAFVENAFRPVERKFHAMEFDRAGLECDRVQDAYRGDEDIRAKARLLKQLIPSFERSWLDAQKKVRVRALESALRPLRRSKELYVQIDLPGSLGDQLDEQLVDSLVASAKAATLRNDLASATNLYREAKRLAPGDDRVEEGLRRLSSRAEELYVEAYMIRERDPKKCIEMLKLVLDVAPRGSDPYEKARAQLKLMEP